MFSLGSDDAVVEIPLPNGKVARVSAQDWRRVSRLSWSDKGGGYVRALNKKSAGGDGQFVTLHRYVLSAPRGYVVDHIDGDPLNNTRENLQITTQSRNLMRSQRALAGGISRTPTGWRVRANVDGKARSFGQFKTQEAAEARLAEVRSEIWGSDVNVTGAVR